jgi:hypothetical protein
MTARNANGSPGSHPHADRPNWRKSETADDYLSNCREGLEEWSQRRYAKLAGVSRAQLWRQHWMAALPDELFDRLMKHFRDKGQLPTSKLLAQISMALDAWLADPDGDVMGDTERCPHCDGVLRFRPWLSADVWDVVADYLRGLRKAPPSP